MAIVPVPARRHARRHPVDMKPDAKGQAVVKLQGGVAKCHPVGIDEGRELCRVDIGDPAIRRCDRFHVPTLPVKRRAKAILTEKSIQAAQAPRPAPREMPRAKWPQAGQDHRAGPPKICFLIRTCQILKEK